MLVSNLDRLIVLAHYNEELSWLPLLREPYTLYTKGLPNHRNFIPLNRGREALCYLKFIVEYYDDLPREIGFFHAHKNSYHQTTDTDVIINNYTWGKFDYVNVCRDDWYNVLNAHSSYTTEYGWVRDFWKLFAVRYLGALPTELQFYPCAQFFVKRERILKHPPAFYLDCLTWLLHTDMECSKSARVFEYLWHIIMGAPNPEPRRSQGDFLKTNSEIVSTPPQTSELECIIPPEIKHDEFYFWIQKLAQEERLSTILEIGSSSGAGSTEAFAKGCSSNPYRPTLFCMEVSQQRFAELAKTYAQIPHVKCYNVSSIPINEFARQDQVAHFYHSTQSALNSYPLERVIGWLDQDLTYVRSSGVEQNGIEHIKRENGIANFDMVLIDGSEFTGEAELRHVYGAKFILLDDVNAFKNLNNYRRLVGDPNYSLLVENRQLRNGFAIFRRNDSALPQQATLHAH